MSPTEQKPSRRAQSTAQTKTSPPGLLAAPANPVDALRCAAPYVGVALCAFALRAIYFWQLRDALPFATLVTDGRVYDTWAQRISAGDWLGSDVFYQAPLYPYFMAVIYRLFGHEVMLVRWVQAGLGSCGCALVALAGSSFFSRTAGLCAGVLLAIYPAAIFFDGLIQKSALDLFLTTAVLAAMGAFLKRPRAGWAVAIGIALGALILNRENARLLYPVLVVWLLLYFRQLTLPRRLGHAAWLSLGAALVLLPVGARNYYVGGEFLLSTSQFGPNFYIGNHRGATGRYEPLIPGRSHTIHERADAVRLAEEAVGRQLTAGEVSNYWRDKSLEFIRNEPAQWLRLMAWKTFLVFHAQELVDSEGIEVFAQYSSLLGSLSWFSFGVLLPLAIVGAWGSRRDWRRLAVLYAMVLGLAASVALFFVFARYRYPIVPVVALFSGAALSQLPAMRHSWQQGGFWRAWGPGWVAALLLLVPLNWPMPQYRDDAVAFANYGKELLDEGRPAEAEAALRRALALSPGYVGARHNLGTALATQGKSLEAIEQYQRVLRDDPQYGRAHWLLGKQLLAAGQHGPGLEHLRQAAALLPEIDLLRIDLGQALLIAGDAPGAVEQFRAALATNPDSLLAINNLIWVLATSPDPAVRNGDEAVALIARLGPLDDPTLLDTAAAAYAEAGRFDDAVAMARRASELARRQGQSSLAEQLDVRRKLYESRQAFRDRF